MHTYKIRVRKLTKIESGIHYYRTKTFTMRSCIILDKTKAILVLLSRNFNAYAYIQDATSDEDIWVTEVIERKVN